MAFRFAPGRPPAAAAQAMVATSQPLATRAGLRALERGGNAADAALAAAAVCCVAEPMSTGVGGDAFALVWDGERAHGLDAAGLGATLRRIGAEGPDALYRGEIARAIASCTWLEEADLAAYEPRWVEPLTIDYRGITVCELPPPTQGVAALEGLGLLALGEPTLPAQVESARLALEDALRHVRDGADVSALLADGALARRRARPALPVTEPPGGTIYLCAVDGEGMAVSFIQSLFEGFGSRVVAPWTGIVLQNRGACFAIGGAVEPGRRPYHTIIPGLLLRDGRLLGPFGVMGGLLQAQAHLQLVSALVDDGLDPQAALDRPRFRVDGATVRLEEGLWERAGELEAAGLEVVRSEERSEFGGGQAILVHDDVLVGGS